MRSKPQRNEVQRVSTLVCIHLAEPAKHIPSGWASRANEVSEVTRQDKHYLSGQDNHTFEVGRKRTFSSNAVFEFGLKKDIISRGRLTIRTINLMISLLSFWVGLNRLCCSFGSWCKGIDVSSLFHAVLVFLLACFFLAVLMFCLFFSHSFCLRSNCLRVSF